MYDYIERIPLDDRLATFPVGRPETRKFYKLAEANFWVAGAIDFSKDRQQFDKMSTEEKNFLKNILAFFAASDKIVNMNLVDNFRRELDIPEISEFYDFQTAMENIHSEAYAIQLDVLISNSEEKQRLFNAVQQMETVKAKANWAYNWMNSDISFPRRLVAFACVEGIHFSGSFCALYWVRNRGLLNGITKANQWISRDEGLHTDFAVHVYGLLKPEYKLPKDEIHEIITNAVKIEQQFIVSSLPYNLEKMNARLMCEYIEYVADGLSNKLGAGKIYNSKCPFDFMMQLEMDNVANFFETRVSEYKKRNVVLSEELTADVDF